MCIQDKNRLTDIEKRIVTKEQGRGDKLVWDWQIQTTIYKIDKKDLQFSTGNYNLKSSNNLRIYIVFHFVVYLKLTQHCKSIILQKKILSRKQNPKASVYSPVSSTRLQWNLEKFLTLRCEHTMDMPGSIVPQSEKLQRIWTSFKR